MNSTILSFLVVAAVAAFTADAMMFGIPMRGMWRNFGGAPGGSPFGFNYSPMGDPSGIKFVPATMVAPGVTAPSAPGPNANNPAMGSLPMLGVGNNFMPRQMFGGMGPAGFAFPFQ